MLLEESLFRRPVLIVAAHPDDETVGAGGILGRMRNVSVAVITDGAPRDAAFARAAGCETREAYAAVRRRELFYALQLAGASRNQVHLLEVPDQDAVLHLCDLARRITAMLGALRPGTVLTHSYEGGHPDHDAAAFAVHAACAMVPVPPDIVEFTSYHADPAHTDPHTAPAWETGRFLPGFESGEAIVLTAEERDRKQKMMQCYGSQSDVLHRFGVMEERFRPAPVYDFTAAPHPGILLYETFGWAIGGAQFRRLAADALQTLNLAGVV